MRNILIFGTGSFLGSEIALRLNERHKVYGTTHKSHFFMKEIIQSHCNITQKEQIQNLLFRLVPDTIIYCIGLSDFHECAKNRQLADALNAFGAMSILEYSDKIQARFIYLSCPFVFDGFRGNFTEDATTIPFTDYGKSKVTAENLVRSRTLNHVILRVPQVIGFGLGPDSGMIQKIRTKLNNKERIQLEGTQKHSFIYIDDLVNAIDYSITAKDIKYRTLNLETPSISTWLEVGQNFAKTFGYDEKLISIQQSQGENAFEHMNFSLKSDYLKNIKEIPQFKTIEEGMIELKKLIF